MYNYVDNKQAFICIFASRCITKADKYDQAGIAKVEKLAAPHGQLRISIASAML
jgi:hypothetical protein